MGQEPPLAAGLHQVARGIEEFPGRIVALRGVRLEGQMRKEELPLGVRDVGGVRFSGGVHDLTCSARL